MTNTAHSFREENYGIRAAMLFSRVHIALRRRQSLSTRRREELERVFLRLADTLRGGPWVS